MAVLQQQQMMKMILPVLKLTAEIPLRINLTAHVCKHFIKHTKVSLKRCVRFDPWDLLLPVAGCIILAFDEWKSVTHLKVQKAVMHCGTFTLCRTYRLMAFPSKHFLSLINESPTYNTLWMMPFKLKKLYSRPSNQSKGSDVLKSEDILMTWQYRVESYMWLTI